MKEKWSRPIDIEEGKGYKIVDKKVVIEDNVRVTLGVKKCNIYASDIHEFFELSPDDPKYINRTTSPLKIWEKFRNVNVIIQTKPRAATQFEHTQKQLWNEPTDSTLNRSYASKNTSKFNEVSWQQTSIDRKPANRIFAAILTSAIFILIVVLVISLA
ncbi:hypothetical protein [Candidatus Mycoplasma haematohominis]|uniref:hypothetical protein n=1 Tax=Candidatus Mycoplasma haematohominis TaxID=1494318 RepID=UPI001C0A6F1C|nr:hypothetical protein [Candidatus Mycoplasma haemohominis]